MTSRRNILGFLSLTTLLTIMARATEKPTPPRTPPQPTTNEFEEWKNQASYHVINSNDPTILRLLGASKTKQYIAFYYYGGSSPRQLRQALVESVFRFSNSPHTYASAHCHLRGEKRIFRVDKISLA